MAFQARVQPLFEELPLAPGALSNAMERLNRLTVANCPSGKFITVFSCVADGQSGRVDWCCAGHNPPLIVRANGSCELLENSGLVMGVFANATYTQMESSLAPGDLLAIYSDGVTEACSPEDCEFRRLRAGKSADRQSRKNRGGTP